MKFEKSKVIFLITLSQNNKNNKDSKEYIVLFYAKEVFEEPPEKLFFYKSYGKDGKAKIIYKGNDVILKQWFAIGNTKEIDQIIKKLISSKEIIVENKTLHFPKVHKKEDKKTTDFFMQDKHVDKYPLPNENSTFYEYRSYPELQEVYFDSIKSDITKNFQYQDIYKTYRLDIFPYGFLNTDDLHFYFVNNIILVDSNILFQFDFHGERSDAFQDLGSGVSVLKEKTKKVPKNFIGVVCHSPIPKHDLGIIISKTKLEETTLESCSIASVDPKTSLFQYTCSDETIEGYLYFIDKKNINILAAQKFILIQNFDIKLDSTGSTAKFLDLLDRNIWINSEKKLVVFKPLRESYSFFRENFPAFDDLGYYRMLSDKIKDILKNLDEELLICDPYFLGKIKDQNGRIKLPDGSTIFFNALLTLLAEYDLKSINFLCRKKMVPDFLDSKNIPKEYQLLKENINKINDLSNLDFRIRFSQDTFHDRYWLGNSENSDVLQINTSISGLVKSNEFKISPVFNEIERDKIRSRIQKFWNNAKTTEVVL